MSKRFFNLLADEKANRWSYTSTGTNATLTAQVGPNVKHAVETHHMDFFHLTILNKNTLDFTMTPAIRDASVGGTILAQWPLLLKGSTVAQVAPAGLHLEATKGKTLFLTTDTVQPSVTATVNAAGWVDVGESY